METAALDSPSKGGIFDEGADEPEEDAVFLPDMSPPSLAQGLPILPPEGLSLKHRMAEIEREFISQALSRTKGNVSQTARLLNVQRTTLIEKIQKFGLRSI
jgi:sigma-54 specific flagellar transcriptional regulator A